MFGLIRRAATAPVIGLLALAFVAVPAATDSTIYPTWNSCTTKEYAIAWGGDNLQSQHTDINNCADLVWSRVQWNNGASSYFSSWYSGAYQANAYALDTAMTVGWGNAKTEDPIGYKSYTFVTGAVYP